jgi:hypothetical protein
VQSFDALRPLFFVVTLLGGTVPAFGGSINFTCAANIDATHAGTCATLNGSIADLYSGAFTNANADIYIQFGPTGLGESLQYRNSVTYADYYAALVAHQAGVNDATAIASLGSPLFNPVVGGQGVSITSALGEALGLSGYSGIETDQSACTVGSAGCYNGIITISNTASLYYRSGIQDPGSYDIYGTIEHEVNEVLGTSSCLTTISGAPGVYCAFPTSGVGAPDLFRYSAAGTRSYLDSANGTPAYFSIDGGVTNIAGYSNSPNGADYGDWNSQILRIQNAFSAPGTGAQDITTDGGSEIAVLDAIGYNKTIAAAPEPGTISLFGVALAIAAGVSSRRKSF